MRKVSKFSNGIQHFQQMIRTDTDETQNQLKTKRKSISFRYFRMIRPFVCRSFFVHVNPTDSKGHVAQTSSKSTPTFSPIFKCSLSEWHYFTSICSFSIFLLENNELEMKYIRRQRKKHTISCELDIHSSNTLSCVLRFIPFFFCNGSARLSIYKNI